MRVKCLAQEHNTMSPARARTRERGGGEVACFLLAKIGTQPLLGVLPKIYAHPLLRFLLTRMLISLGGLAKMYTHTPGMFGVSICLSLPRGVGLKKWSYPCAFWLK